MKNEYIHELAFQRMVKEPYFLGYWLAQLPAWKREGPDGAAKVFGIDLNHLAVICLYRAPRPESWHEDVDTICACSHLDHAHLEAILREVGLQP